MATIEEALTALLDPLAAGGAHPDAAPASTALPFITYQQVGGKARQYLEKRLPDYRHARIQINVWAKRRSEANTLARRIERAIIESPLVAEAYGAFVATDDDVTNFKGTRQDFGFWHPDA